MSRVLQMVEEELYFTIAKVAAITLVAIPVGQAIQRFFWRRFLRQKVRQRQKECQEAFRKLDDDLNSLNFDREKLQAIHCLPTSELQEGLQSGKYSALEVLVAYQTKAVQVNKRLNCVTEPILEAEADAKSLDEHTEKEGLLYGIPVSLKENYQLKGYDCTMGLVNLIGKLWEEDAVMIKVRKCLEPVFFNGYYRICRKVVLWRKAITAEDMNYTCQFRHKDKTKWTKNAG